LKRSLLNKFKRKPLKRTLLKKKPKVINHEEIERINYFFFSIWRKTPHYCTICGAWLDNEPHSYMFDHILEKEKYPDLTYEEGDIALLCLSCHDCKTRGFFPESYALLIKKTKELFDK